MRGFISSAVVLILATVLAIAKANEGTCVVETSNCKIKSDLPCSAWYGSFARMNVEQGHSVGNNTESLIMSHLRASLTFTKMASTFGEVQINRPGFYNYFNKLSDETWEDGIRIMKHYMKRGGTLKNFVVEQPKEGQGHVEVDNLSMAVNEEKKLWESTQELIHLANSLRPGEDGRRDGHFAHFLVDEVAERHVDRIKDITNHVNTLTKALEQGTDYGLTLFLYDTEFLK